MSGLGGNTDLIYTAHSPYPKPPPRNPNHKSQYIHTYIHTYILRKISFVHSWQFVQRVSLGLPASQVSLLAAVRRHPLDDPPRTRRGRKADREPKQGDGDPVPAHPEDELGIGAMPRAALDVMEEAVTVALDAALRQDADAMHFDGGVGPGPGLQRGQVLDPHHGQEQRAGGVHHSDVRQQPVAVVEVQRVDHAGEERVLSGRRPARRC